MNTNEHNSGDLRCGNVRQEGISVIIIRHRESLREVISVGRGKLSCTMFSVARMNKAMGFFACKDANKEGKKQQNGKERHEGMNVEEREG